MAVPTYVNRKSTKEVTGIPKRLRALLGFSRDVAGFAGRGSADPNSISVCTAAASQADLSDEDKTAGIF